MKEKRTRMKNRWKWIKEMKIESLMIAVVEKYECNVMKKVPLIDNERRECDWKDKTSKHVDVLKKVMGKINRGRRNIKGWL